MSIPTLVPAADRAPSLASRVVTIHATDVTEGAPAPDHFTFSLAYALRVPDDDVILRPGGVKVRLVDGKASIRLPVYSCAVQTGDGSSDWVIKVTPSWGHEYPIRVPAGSSSISLADLPAVRPLTRHEQMYAVTSVGVTVTEGTQASGSASLVNGQLNLKLKVPAFRPQTVYPCCDETADGRPTHYEKEARADREAEGDVVPAPDGVPVHRRDRGRARQALREGSAGGPRRTAAGGHHCLRPREGGGVRGHAHGMARIAARPEGRQGQRVD